MKHSVRKFVDRYIKDNGDSCEAAVLIVLGDDHTATALCGCDQYLIGPEAVKIAVSIQHILDTEFEIASTIAKKISGQSEKIVKTVSKKIIEVNEPSNADASGDDSFDAFIEGFLKKMMEDRQ